jgi:hypothetical protein
MLLREIDKDAYILYHDPERDDFRGYSTASCVMSILKMIQQMQLLKNVDSGKYAIGGCLKTAKINIRIIDNNKIKDRSYNIRNCCYGNKYLEKVFLRYFYKN